MRSLHTNPEAAVKTVLCYGDSNTWGYIPGTGQRYRREQRWPGVLQAELGEGVFILEEGLNSRTTVLDDPTRPHRNGLTYLRPCLDSHAPLDLVLLMLGTNDLKHRFGLSPFDVSANVTMLVAAIAQSQAGQAGKSPPVLLLSPASIGPLTGFAELFAGAEEKSRQLARFYRSVAEQTGCAFFDVAEVVRPSPVDGVHWEADQHAALGKRLAGVVRQVLNPSLQQGK